MVRPIVEYIASRTEEHASVGVIDDDELVHPGPVLTEAVLAALRPGSLIVDLASKPGGTDFAAASAAGAPGHPCPEPAHGLRPRNGGRGSGLDGL